MCITFLYISQDSFKDKYKVILAMNRDEFFKRPTSKSDWTDDVLAGRDQEPGREGGTWLGINAKGRIGFLTNIYAGKHQSGAGRGFLVIDYLRSSGGANEYLTNLSLSDTVYSPFNLMLLEPGNGDEQYSIYYYCKGHPMCVINESIGPHKLDPGFHSISNHPKDQPYRKTQYGQDQFSEILKKYMTGSSDHKDEMIEKIFELMKIKTSFHPDPQMIKQAGVSSSMSAFHEKLACVNVDIPEKDYGTRTTSIVLIDHENNATFIEKDQKTNETTYHSFKIK